MIDISVLIVTKNRVSSLKRLVESVLSFAGPHTVEILVSITGDDKETEMLLASLISRYEHIRYFKSLNVNRGEARNRLIKMSGGKIVYFLDDDAVIQKDVFLLIKDKFQLYSDVAILGGPNLTLPDSPLFLKCQGYALGSFFGTWFINQRYKITGQDRYVNESGLILCNLVVKKEIFAEANIWFPADFSSAEENLLLLRLEKSGYRSMYIPTLEVFHERRATYREFFNQMLSYGSGRGQIFRTFPCHIKSIHFVPALFLAYLLSMIFVRTYVYSIPLVAYLALNSFVSSTIAYDKKDARIFLLLFLIFPTIHIAYACGFLKGIMRKVVEAR